MSGKAEVLRMKVDRASRSEQQQPVAPVQSCPNKNWIELVYKYDSSYAVSGANYSVFDLNGRQLASGNLDRMGFARVEGLPDGITNVKFSFSSDPKPFEIFPGYKPVPNQLPPPNMSPVQVRAEDGAIVSVAKWVWGSVQGDFNEDQSFGQIAFGSAVTLIPVVDQAGDVRDVAAALHKLVLQKRYDEFSPWMDLVFTLIGCFPEIGTAIKGVLKSVMQGIGKVGKKLHLDVLIRMLNKVGEGNALRWLRELLGKLAEHGKQAEKQIFKILAAIEEKLSQIKRFALGKVKQMANAALETIGEVTRRVSGKVAEVVERAAKRLKEMLDDAVDYMLEGATRRKNGAKQLTEEFPRKTPPPLAPALALQKKAASVGMEMREVQALQKHCNENGRRIIVRGTNKSGLKYHNIEGYVPKPLDVKLKGAKKGEFSGLVVRPQEPMKDWEKKNVEELIEKKYRFDENNVLVDPKGNRIYSDYDLQAVHREAYDETGKKIYMQEMSDDDVVKEVNDSIGLGRPGEKGKPVQHPAENDFRVKKDSEGNVLVDDHGKPVMASDKEINEGKTTLGRQYGDDENYLVINADGSVEVLDNPGQLHDLYTNPEDALPWEYNAVPAKAAR